MNIPNNMFMFIDVVVLLIYVVTLFFAYKRGFLFEVINLLFTLFTMFIAWFLAPIFANLFPIIKLDKPYSLLHIEPMLNTLVFFLIIVIIIKLISMFILPLFKKFSNIPLLGGLNRLLGLIIGFINATIIVLVLSMLLSTPLVNNRNEVKENTVFKYVEVYSNEAFKILADNFDFKHISNQIKDFDVDKAREDFKEWLLNQELLK